MSTVLLFKDAPHHPALRTALDRFGYQILGELSDANALLSEALRLAPGIIIVTTESPSDATLESVSAITNSSPRPVVMFARDQRRDVIRKAVECGVSAYVVDGFAPERVPAIIEAATARFEAYQAVKRELAATRTKLSERKVIEQAKGIIMRERGLAEHEAYSALRKMAMDQSVALAELARRVIAVAGLLR